ncbi:hypothetical protein OHA77_24890 [Streptosporangium sp. NBC_01639]|uniref:hypothetical protein n=1 Tax=Streptosporangium sp. NBC_01639 TaxID=2975948 RepID=UPI00386B1D4B|nr:hypothetical protein OHA77_24890 [Streptosporangium sp. NBC_01639]
MSGHFDQGIDVSHADLRGTGAGLGEAGTTWLEAVGALRAHLEGEGDPWGEEAGSMVKAGYLAVTRRALEVYEELGKRQVTSGDDVHIMEANYRDAEQRNLEDAARNRSAIERL